ncbi:hypothetical protein [Nocardia takedensis]|uniref:hypothetical protein n=1 Tax=Nocardia takedensis TaxID=259390 RepID=UPI001575E6ED|nr:hypothetical protein [Nocardia takedensis]
MAPATNAGLGSVRIEAALGRVPAVDRRGEAVAAAAVAFENADVVGRDLSRWHIARGETVLDVPTTATARVRELFRGGQRKSDQIDAVAAACVVALQSPVPLETAYLHDGRIRLAHIRASG